MDMIVCAKCGQENPEGFSFCGRCGAPLTAEPSREERKIVTVLFADLVGFTGHSEQLDPEDVRGTLAAVLRAAPHRARALRRHRREVHRRRGDGRSSAPRSRTRTTPSGPCAPRSRSATRWRTSRAGRAPRAHRRHHRRGARLARARAEPRARAMAAGDVVNTAARLQSTAPVNGDPRRRADLPRDARRHRLPRGRARPREGQGRAGARVGGARARARASAIDVAERSAAPLVGPRARSSAHSVDALERARREPRRSSSRSSASPGSARAASPPSSPRPSTTTRS